MPDKYIYCLYKDVYIKDSNEQKYLLEYPSDFELAKPEISIYVKIIPGIKYPLQFKIIIFNLTNDNLFLINIYSNNYLHGIFTYHVKDVNTNIGYISPDGISKILELFVVLYFDTGNAKNLFLGNYHIVKKALLKIFNA